MGKLTDLQIYVLFDDQNISFKTPVSVTKEGVFTTTLPKDIVDKLLEYDATLASNRVGTLGYFSAKRLEDLRPQIKEVIENAMSRKLIEDKLVIKYEIRTQCVYVVDADGEILPNGGWVKDREKWGEGKAGWREGTINMGNYYTFTPRLSIYANVFKKETYQFKNGRTIVKYSPYKIENTVPGGNVDWLCGQIRVKPECINSMHDENVLKRLPEVDATEENAAVFVQMLKFMFKANEIFKNLAKPENLLAFVKQNTLAQIEEIIKDR